MNIQKILTDPALQPLIFIPIVTFILGIIGSVLTQLAVDRRQRLVITYSQRAEAPLTLAKNELKDKLQIAYEGNKIDTLYSFNLKVANTGKKMIKKQIFSCTLTDGSHSIAPAFPSIKLHSSTPVQVGPVNLLGQTDHSYRYQIEKISVGQVIELDFLVTSNKKCDLKIEFEALEEVKYQRGDIANIPTLGTHIMKLASFLVLFFLFMQFLTAFPFPYNVLGLAGIPFVFFALGSFRTIISILSAQPLNIGNKYFYGIEMSGGEFNAHAIAIGEQAQTIPATEPFPENSRSNTNAH